jgi:hypothetical protein
MLNSGTGSSDKDLSVRRREEDGRRMYESWFWKGDHGHYLEHGVLERSEADGEALTDRGIEDVDEDVKMEYVRGCRHAILMYPRIIWI